MLYIYSDGTTSVDRERDSRVGRIVWKNWLSKGRIRNETDCWRDFGGTYVTDCLQPRHGGAVAGAV